MNATHIRDFIVSDCVTTLIRVQAGQLCRRLGICYADRDDFQQEMYLHLLHHVEHFDPQRGSLLTYIRHLVKCATLRIMRKRRSLKRNGELHMLSLDEIVPDVDGETIFASEMLSDTDLQRRIGIETLSSYEQFEQSDAIEHAYYALSMRKREVRRLLIRRSPTAVAHEMATSRRQISNIVQVIRNQLETAGLKKS